MKGFETVKKVGLAALAASALGLYGCSGTLATSNTSSVLLEITEILGISENGGTAGTPSSVLLSDVLFKGGVFNDNAQLDLIAITKNPNASLTTSDLNSIYLDSYEVHYTRTDGADQQGVDVPYDISGPMSGAIPVGSATPVLDSIIVVRHQAKLEPPLSLLDNGGQQAVITVIATITVHGHTLEGQNVQATGSLEIVFADFGDSD